MKRLLYNNISAFIRKYVLLLTAIVTAVPASAQDIPDADGIFAKKYISAFNYDTMEGTLTLESFVTGKMKLVSEPFDVVMVLDVSGSMRGRIDELQAGAEAVLDQIYEHNTQSGADRRLGIVTFGSGDETDTRVIAKLAPVTASNYAAIKTSIESIRDGGSTNSDYGFELALEMLRHPEKNVTFSSDVKGREGDDYRDYAKTKFDSQTFVIFFTDGMPGDSNGDMETGEITTELSYVFKTKGAKVYSIGLFENDPSTTWIETDNYGKILNVKTYLERVSSLYEGITGFDWSYNPIKWYGNTTVNTDGVNYFMRVVNVNKLADTFSSIGTQIIGVASQSLTSETIVKDIISADCTLPDGVQVSDVKVYSADCISGNDTDGYLFDDKEDQSADVTIIVAENTVNVTNFDFGANWVGYNTSTSSHNGKKLIIEIPFKVLPGALAGKDIKMLRTNGERSGIYEGPTSENPIKTYPVPEVDYIDLTIRALGMLTGESAIFKVERKMADESEFSVIATIALTGVSEDGATAVSSKVLYQDPDATYKVTDATGWSWSYTLSSDVSQIKTKVEGETSIEFEFSKAKKDITIENAENNKDNRFTTYTSDGISVTGNWFGKEKEL